MALIEWSKIHSRIHFRGEVWLPERLRARAHDFAQRIQGERSASRPLITWQGHNHPDAVALFLAAAELGLWFHSRPADAPGSLDRFRDFGDVLVFEENGFNRMPAAGLSEWQAGSGLLLPSSGSGGQPRFCRLPIEMCEANARYALSLLGLNSQTPAVVSSSFEHTAGWNTLLIPALIAGSPVYLAEKFSAHEIAGLLPKIENGVYHFSPMQAELLTRLNSWPELKAAPGSLAVVGSSDTHSRLLRELLSKKIGVVRNYGLTEAGPYVISRKLNEGDDCEALGVLASGFSMKLEAIPGVDAAFELLLSGGARFDGYLNDTAPEWIATGDAFRLVDGTIHFLCRKSHLLKSGSRWFAPNQMESDLLNNFGFIHECLAQCESFQDWKLSLVGEIKRSGILKIRRHLKENFGVGEVRVEILPRLKRTRSGKIIRPEVFT